MERRKLTHEEITDHLSEIAGWNFEDEKLQKRFEFKDFAESLDFVNRIGEIAEAADHHPDITFGWGYALVKTTTHDRDGVTDMDIDLASKVNVIALAEK